MRLCKMWLTLAGAALIAAMLAGCASPTLRAKDVQVGDGESPFVEHNAEFVDASDAQMASVNVRVGPHDLPSDGMTEIRIEVAHRQGTHLESLEFDFRPGLFTPVYLDPPLRWLDGMEFVKMDDRAVLNIPELGDQGKATVVYTFLAPTRAMSEQAGGLPLTVTFVLDGTEAMAEFALRLAADPAGFITGESAQ